MTNEKTKKQTEKSKMNETKLPAGAISSRGRSFQGTVIRKFDKRVTIEFERTVKIPKYERFMKKKTRIHARLPEKFIDSIHKGDLIRVKECRPLSKTIHFVVVEKIRDADKTQETQEAKN
ncbi:MAG: 30S ribosomal protein S17 [Nanoarchaeota archaeon]|nr:30S ribosomal protein S17 [Nanoarchaeota archaeon]